MIVVTNRDTLKDAYIPEDDIEKMEERKEEIHNRTYPYTRVHIRNDKEKFRYFVDAVESEKKILKLIDEERARQKDRKNIKKEDDEP